RTIARSSHTSSARSAASASTPAWRSARPARPATPPRCTTTSRAGSRSASTVRTRIGVARYRFEWLFRPGRDLDDVALAALCTELTAVGETCLEPLPMYQVFLATRDELS